MSYATLIPGAVFGRLTVLSATSKRNSHGDIIYLCACACGNEKLTTSIWACSLLRLPSKGQAQRFETRHERKPGIQNLGRHAQTMH